jgi:hypothetical protein
MAAPNLLNLTTITAKTAVDADVAATAATLVSNTAASGKVLKINSLYITNIDGNNTADITVDLYRSSVAYIIADTITVVPGTSVVIISEPDRIYLEEGDDLRITASAAGDLSAVCSYEDIS